HDRVAAHRVGVDENTWRRDCGTRTRSEHLTAKHRRHFVICWIERLLRKDQIDLVLRAGLRLAKKPGANRVSIEGIESDVASGTHGAEHGQGHRHLRERECRSQFSPVTNFHDGYQIAVAVPSLRYPGLIQV